MVECNETNQTLDCRMASPIIDCSRRDSQRFDSELCVYYLNWMLPSYDFGYVQTNNTTLKQNYFTHLTHTHK